MQQHWLSPWHKVKVKVKCTLVQALRLCTGRTAHRGSRGIALLFLDHGTRRGWGVNIMSRPLFTPRKGPVPILQEADGMKYFFRNWHYLNWPRKYLTFCKTVSFTAGNIICDQIQGRLSCTHTQTHTHTHTHIHCWFIPFNNHSSLFWTAQLVSNAVSSCCHLVLMQWTMNTHITCVW